LSSIFISHSSHDNGWAERICEWLKDEQKQRPQEQRYRSMFLDFDPDDGIKAGERWRDQLYEHLQLCAAVIVICSEAYGQSQWCLAELGVAMASGKLVLPVRIAAGTPLPKLLSETQATALAVIDLEQGAASGWQRLLKGLEPLSWQSRLPWPPPGEPGASPFPGLERFERRHAAVFFGQDRVLRTLRETINQLPQRQSRLLLILGASGCGKSSLLRAGLLPWLEEADKGRWIVLEPFRPEEDPAPALAAALQQAHRALALPLPAEDATTAEALHHQLRQLRLQSAQQDARVVIPIDQFEEVLGRGDARNPSVAAAADAFLALLAQLLAMKNSQVLIIATLRSDFFGQFQLHPSGLHGWAGDPIALGPMDPSGFRQVIEGPAVRVGLRLEPGLSDALVADTETGDALPLLAFTLEELWKQRVAGAGLTLEQYETFGRLKGAVQRKADAVLAQSLPAPKAEEIAALQQAFVVHLIRLTTDGQAAKQPARRSLLPPESLRLVDLFVEARLLVSGVGEAGDQVEIAHEALLRTWPTLVGWIAAGREDLLQRLRVGRMTVDLKPEAPESHRRQALEQLAALAAAGGSEERAVAMEASEPLRALLAWVAAPEEDQQNAVMVSVADREDAALVLALIGAEEPLRMCLANLETPVALRRRAAESLGLLARRSGEQNQRERIADELKNLLLSSEPLDVRIEVELDLSTLDSAMVKVLVEQTQQQVAEEIKQMMGAGQLPADLGEAQLREIFEQNENRIFAEQLQQQLWASGQAPGWKEHDARLPLLQGASRGLQLAVSPALPMLGAGPGRVVPMLTLSALEEGSGLRIRTEVVEKAVWKLPLPKGEQLELVVVPAGPAQLGSPATEQHRQAVMDWFAANRDGCEGVDVEALRPVGLEAFALVRQPISQRQWRAVVEAVDAIELPLDSAPGAAKPESLWELHAQPGELAVDSVSWQESREWLGRLNRWLRVQWDELGGSGGVAELALPSENQWEGACRAGAATPFHFGDTLDGSWARYNTTALPFGRGRKASSKPKKPWVNGTSGLVNRFGLAELHGQLYEWCEDSWHPNPVANGHPEDGDPWREEDTELVCRGSGQRSWKPLRGSSWFYEPVLCRAAFRCSGEPNFGDFHSGLRPCCPFPPGSLLAPTVEGIPAEVPEGSGTGPLISGSAD
jgi:formylglycine-generating enzyme required for sulfatase activity